MLVITILTFTSCSKTTSPVEINHRSIVHAVGVDKGENGGYEVSVQIFFPTESGSETPVNASSVNAKVVTASGETIYDAVKNCEYLLGGDIFMGHNKFIIFGSSLYNEDMKKLLDWFSEENENYLGVTVGFSETSAKEILDVKLTEGASAVENMELVQKYASENGFTVKGDLLVLLNSLNQESKSGLMPVFSVKKEQQTEDKPSDDAKENPQYFYISRTAVLKNGKVSGFLTEEETSGVLWLSGEMDKSSINLDIDGKSFSCELTQKNCSPSLEIIDGRVVISIDITAKAKLTEKIDDTKKKQVAYACQQKILDLCEIAFTKTVVDLRTDVLRIEKLLKFYKPQIFRAYREDFDRIISATSFDVTVKVKLTN